MLRGNTPEIPLFGGIFLFALFMYPIYNFFSIGYSDVRLRNLS